MTSVGKSGATGHLQDRDAYAKGLTTFDCRPNILRLLQHFDASDREWVVSTWDDEDTGSIDSSVPVIRSKDRTRRVRGRVGTWSRNNKFRQMYGMLRGVEHFRRSSEVDLVVRIRTDQFLDVDQLVTSAIQAHATPTHEQRLLVPFQNPNIPWFLEDFYMAGRPDLLESTLRFYLDEGDSFHHFAHTDYFYKFAFHLLGRSTRPPARDFFPYLGTPRTSGHCAVVAEAWNQVFAPLSTTIWTSLIWRGEPLSSQQLVRPRIHSETFDGIDQRRLVREAVATQSRPDWCAPTTDWGRLWQHRLGGRLGRLVGSALLNVDRMRRHGIALLRVR